VPLKKLYIIRVKCVEVVFRKYEGKGPTGRPQRKWEGIR